MLQTIFYYYSFLTLQSWVIISYWLALFLLFLYTLHRINVTFFRKDPTANNDFFLTIIVKGAISNYKILELNSDDLQKLPSSPTDKEKYIYIKRNNTLLLFFSLLSFVGVFYSTRSFLNYGTVLWPLYFYFLFTVLYFITSFLINLFSRDFDFKKHKKIKAKWATHLSSRVDIFLPTAGESLELLKNTWDGINELRKNYPGIITPYCLDDSNRRQVKLLAAMYEFEYVVRPKTGWFKKAGNLRYGYKVSNGEFIAVFDADFRPRSDFFHELLPYFYEYRDVGLVQSPQYFDVTSRQNWLQRGAGAVQEFFYRVSQVSRDAHNASICVGTNAVYRRTALADIGGTALIEHSEDVHTGFDLRARGWKLYYVPIILAKGLCPTDLHAFFKQQYRWCLGSLTLLISKKFWTTDISVLGRLSYFSGFLYYIHTAVTSVILPIFPLIILFSYPENVSWGNYLFLIPSFIYMQVLYPSWHKATYGIETWAIRIIYGWAHLFAIIDALFKNTMSWQPTGSVISKDSRYIKFRIIQVFFNLLPSILWVSLSFQKVFFENRYSFIPVLIGGIYFYSLSAKISFYRTLDEPYYPGTFTPKLSYRFLKLHFLIPLLIIATCISLLQIVTSNYKMPNIQLRTESTLTDVKPKLTTNNSGKNDNEIAVKRLNTSWKYYKENFVTENGQSINPTSEDKTTSEGQSYILLRAVLADDKLTFDKAWGWTSKNLQHEDDSLFSWLWGVDGTKEQILDTRDASDADQDIALALIMANNKWSEDQYLSETKKILTDIWNKDVIQVNSKYYLLAGSHFNNSEGYVINPSYLSPASYRIFAKVDPDHQWNLLARDSYSLLFDINQDLDAALLPPNWILLTKQGKITTAEKFIENDASVYGYDAFRTYFRIALDAKWYDSDEAKMYLSLPKKFFQEEWDNNKAYSSIYYLDGRVKQRRNSISTNVGPLSVFSITNPNLAEEVHGKLFESKYNELGFWGDGKEYYDQNWVWFWYALYSDLYVKPRI